MSKVVIEVNKVSKLYRLGQIGSGSFKQELSAWWNSRVLKKENHFLHPLTQSETDGAKNFIWSLKDISFSVKEGEVWGIIGNNGSGKSTLLKIISRIISPTRGQVRGRGKISSMLEVGTGFNPELTGRQNIFLSGYILGMNKQEITSKFDEIVAFSGIERFLDTPVKRYSSGMYVRLAFAVAAHLEPDILIIDEVLAVGDVEFQQKCLAKIQEVSSNKGRTILFVSHDLQTLANLCNHALWLENGKTKEMGPALNVVNQYLLSAKSPGVHHSWEDGEEAPGNELVRLHSVSVTALNESSYITVKTPILVQAEFFCETDGCNLEVCFSLHSGDGICLFDLGSPTIPAEKGLFEYRAIIPPHLLNDKMYSVSLVVLKNNAQVLCELADCARFDVADLREGDNFYGDWNGLIRPRLEIEFLSKKRKKERA